MLGLWGRKIILRAVLPFSLVTLSFISLVTASLSITGPNKKQNAYGLTDFGVMLTFLLNDSERTRWNTVRDEL